MQSELVIENEWLLVQAEEAKTTQATVRIFIFFYYCTS